MHTSTRLTSSDFYFHNLIDDQRVSITFSDFCPDYHILDRVGVVSPKLSDGILHAGRTLLALTTAFYDARRARGKAFFDYPQHFAFVGTDSVDQQAEAGATWGAWSKLDVWPDNKWVIAPPAAAGMLQAIFDHQINRLLWPSDLWPAPDEDPLPDYVYGMLGTSLKSIYLYGDMNASQPTIRVSGSVVTEQVWAESLERLPDDSCVESRRGQRWDLDYLSRISTEQFLERMGFKS